MIGCVNVGSESSGHINGAPTAGIEMENVVIHKDQPGAFNNPVESLLDLYGAKPFRISTLD